jgi:hypothetical protein
VEDRASLLRKVLSFEQPLGDTLALLQAYGWDSDEELVVLTRQDASTILERYLAGSLTGEDVEYWAEILELRDDVGFEGAHSDDLKHLIFWLANPDINEALTPTLAIRMLRVLWPGAT